MNIMMRCEIRCPHVFCISLTELDLAHDLVVKMAYQVSSGQLLTNSFYLSLFMFYMCRWANQI